MTEELDQALEPGRRLVRPGQFRDAIGRGEEIDGCDLDPSGITIAELGAGGLPYVPLEGLASPFNIASAASCCDTLLSVLDVPEVVLPVGAPLEVEVRASADTRHFLLQSRTAAGVLYMIVGGAAALHTAAIFLDSTLTFGTGNYGNLGVPPLPVVYATYEQWVVASLFVISTIGRIPNAVASWLRR